MLATYTYPVFDLPAGPKNLSALMPALDWRNTASYYVELRDQDDQVLLRTATYKMTCCCDSDKVRVHFRNSLGKFDAVNFPKPSILHENSSAEFKRRTPINLSKTDFSLERFGISSNDTYTCSTSCYGESAMPWLMELADSGIAFLEWKGVQGQSDSYIPIRIIDGKFDKQKNVDEFMYLFTITFKKSNEIFIQR